MLFVPAFVALVSHVVKPDVREEELSCGCKGDFLLSLVWMVSMALRSSSRFLSEVLQRYQTHAWVFF